MKKSQLKSIIKECIHSLLSESMTFSVDGTYNPNIFSNLLELSFILQKAIYKPLQNMSDFEKERFQKERAPDLITPDGLDSFNTTGTINFYVAGLSIDVIKQVVSIINKRLNELGVEFSTRHDDSKMYDSKVIRYDISSTSTDGNESQKAPEINYSNANAIKVLKFLGYDEIAEDYGGSINAKELIFRINNLKKSAQDYSRPKYDSDMEKFRNPDQERKGAHVIDPGLSAEDIESRVSRLREMAEWAIKNGYNKISVS